MEISGPKIKKNFMSSEKLLFLHFGKWNLLEKINGKLNGKNLLYFRRELFQACKI